MLIDSNLDQTSNSLDATFQTFGCDQRSGLEKLVPVASDLSGCPGPIVRAEIVVNETKSGRRFWALALPLMLLPFLVGLVTIFCTGDRVPTVAAIKWFCNGVELGAVLVSLLVPLRLIVREPRKWNKTLFSAFAFCLLWVCGQFFALVCLGVLSVAMYGDH